MLYFRSESVLLLLHMWNRQHKSHSQAHFSFSISDVCTDMQTYTSHSLTALLPGKEFPTPQPRSFTLVLFLLSRRLDPRNSYHLPTMLRLSWQDNSTSRLSSSGKKKAWDNCRIAIHFAAITNTLNTTQPFFSLPTKGLVFLVAVMIISYRIFKQLILSRVK